MRFHRGAKPLVFGTTLVAALFVGLTIIALTPAARAHSADIQAYITLTPPVATVGQHTVKIYLRDAYGSAIPGARLLVSIEARGSRSNQGPELREELAGIYRGRLTFTDPGPVLLRFEAVLSDGPWIGQMPITVGPGGRTLQAVGVSLRHRDAPAVTLLGWIVVAAFVLGVVGVAMLGVRLFLEKGQVAQTG
jgi:hypothetical protein